MKKLIVLVCVCSVLLSTAACRTKPSEIIPETVIETESVAEIIETIRETVSAPYIKPVTADEESLSAVEKQMQAVRNQDFEVFKGLFDMERLQRILAGTQQTEFADTSITEEVLAETFQSEAYQEAGEILQNLNLSEISLADFRMISVKSLDNSSTVSKYTARIEDTEYVADFEILFCNQETEVIFSGIAKAELYSGLYDFD